jgi:hypothetical protein
VEGIIVREARLKFLSTFEMGLTMDMQTYKSPNLVQ